MTKAKAKPMGPKLPKAVAMLRGISLRKAPSKRKSKGKTRGIPRSVGVAYGTTQTRNITTIRVARRERLLALVSPSTGTGICTSAYINAGNIAGGTTSYLGRQAALFDKYQFKKLRFIYVPILATTTGGNVIIGTDISPNDATPTDASGMTNLSGGYAEGNVWKSFSHDMQVFASYSTGPKLIRSTTFQLAANATLYDTCSMYAYVEGAPGSTTLGYLDVDYDVDLIGVNRNQVASTANSSSVLGQSSLTFTGTTITPSLNYPNSSFASFKGVNLNTVNSLTGVGTLVLNQDWGQNPVLSVGTNTINVGPGTYEIEAQATFLSDTYANGYLRLNCNTFTTGFIKVPFGFGPLTYPTTSYVNSQTNTVKAIITLPIADTINVAALYNYSGTTSANQTCNIAFQDINNIQLTRITIRLIGSPV